MSDTKKQVEMSEETRRLVRGLEAFAYAAGIASEDFVRGLRAALSGREEDVGLAVSALPAVGPYRAAALAAEAEPEPPAEAPPSPVEPPAAPDVPAPVQNIPEPEAGSEASGDGPPHLAWFDRQGGHVGSIRFVPGLPTGPAGDLWVWSALVTVVGEDPTWVDGSSASFATAYSDVVEAFGANLSRYLAVPTWAAGRRGSLRAARTLLERALPRHDVRGARVELDVLRAEVRQLHGMVRDRDARAARSRTG